MLHVRLPGPKSNFFISIQGPAFVERKARQYTRCRTRVDWPVGTYGRMPVGETLNSEYGELRNVCMKELTLKPRILQKSVGSDMNTFFPYHCPPIHVV